MTAENNTTPVKATDGAPEKLGSFRAPKITTLSTCAVIAAAILSIAAIVVIVKLFGTIDEAERVHEHYNECTAAASELMIASDYLTTECRMFVVTGDRRFMDGYYEELLATKRRDAAVDTLSSQAGDERAADELIAALGESNELAALESYAMALTCDAIGTNPLPDAVAAVELKPEDKALSASEKRALAESMVLGDKYREMKALISGDVDDCAAELVRGLEAKVLAIEHSTDRLLIALAAIIVFLMAIVAGAALGNYVLLMRPIGLHEKSLQKGEPFDIVGCLEIRRVANSYNKLLAAAKERAAYLQHEAETDALTGAFNRGSYDRLLEQQDDNYALVLADIDHFKDVNDQYGHEVGDKVLQMVVEAITNRFRSTDYVCRIGGDEFAVILPKAGPENRNVIEKKLAAISDDISKAHDGLPQVTISFGVAFCGEEDANLHHNADKALYGSKRSGRNKTTFYGD